MISRKSAILTLLAVLFSAPAKAVYFPDGVAWTHPSSEQFVLSLYLNTLGRAPQQAELNNQTDHVSKNDSREQRLALFQRFVRSREYQRLFQESERRWSLYRAPDYNYENGNGYWRYLAATSAPAGFEQWNTDGPYSQSIAATLASYYNSYCYQGLPCANNPAAARTRGSINESVPASNNTHACADESQQNSQFVWVANNGTTYPQGIDNQILCMGQHYYQVVNLDLQRYQCEVGYLNCKRNVSLDLNGRRSGQDQNGNPTLFFADGSRLTFTDTISQPNTSGNDQTTRTERQSGQQHECADSSLTTSQYRWRGPNGTSVSRGVDTTVVCMEDFYYVIEGTNLRRYDCNASFFNCQRSSSGDISATKRTRVNGNPGLEFRNGTTLTLIRRATQNAPAASSRAPTNDVLLAPTSRTRTQNKHDCADAVRRKSQFRWLKQDGSSTWPDGIDGRIVCLADSYYVIKGITLRHHQCEQGFTNCRANSRKDLIATRNTQSSNGYNTLIFANGDQLSILNK